jgi:alpha-tubulin suppressor-like RCC1 family protein
VPSPSIKTGAFLNNDIISVSSGDYFTCAILSDKNGYCWGDNGFVLK